MNGLRKKTGLAFKIIAGLAIFNFVIFFASFLLFGLCAGNTNDADIKGGIGDVFKYHFSDIKGLFSFNFHNGSNVVYSSLSGLLYFLLLITVLCLIFGIQSLAKKKKPVVVVFGIVAVLLIVFVYIIMATGLPKYWAIINQRGAFTDNKVLIAPTFLILAFGVLYALVAYILYFYSLFLAIKSSNEEKAVDSSEAKEEKSEPLLKKESEVVVPAKEEPVEEDQPEEKPNDDEPVEFEEVDIPVSEIEEDVKNEKIIDMTNVGSKDKINNINNDSDDLKSILKELIRDVVRDEIARNNANQDKNDKGSQDYRAPGINGPFVVQYFNGVPNYEQPVKPQEPVKEEPKPVVDKPPVEEEKPVTPQPEIKQMAVKQEAVKPVALEKESEEKKPIIRIPFIDRMLSADKEMQDNYNELKNEILSYGVNSRVSNSGDTFRLHRKTYVKITIAGLSLKLYFALNPDDYKDSTLPIQNAGHKGIYEEIPLVFKVKSGLSMRRCKQLIQDVFDKNGFEQGEIGNINWVEDLRNSANFDPNED